MAIQTQNPSAYDILTKILPNPWAQVLTRYGPNRPAAAIGGGDFLVWTLLVALEAAMASDTASENRSDLRFEISDLIYLQCTLG